MRMFPFSLPTYVNEGLRPREASGLMAGPSLLAEKVS